MVNSSLSQLDSTERNFSREPWERSHERGENIMLSYSKEQKTAIRISVLQLIVRWELQTKLINLTYLWFSNVGSRVVAEERNRERRCRANWKAKRRKEGKQERKK